MLPLRACAIALLLASAGRAEEATVLEWRCDDLIVVGRIATLAYTDMSGEDDVLGHGRFDLRVTVKRRLHGADRRRLLLAGRVAHSQFRSDRDFLMVLARPASGDRYDLTAAALWQERPRPVLAPTCSAPS